MTFLGDKLDQHCSLESLIQKVKLCLNKLKTKLLLDKWKQRIVRRQIELHPEKWKPSACIKDRTSRVITTKLDLGLNLNPIWNSVLMDTPDWAFLEFTSFISFFFFCLFLVWHQPCLCAGIVTLVSVQFVMYMQLKKAFWAETSHFITVSSATCNASTNSLSSEPLWH